ncbi:DUF885 domain-containing protein [Aliikangiella coralliicola]|uniref:DUF885 domain-containing protein n=1 Tax=Aliikangiella coralliicola TaxID=2592383 RepID=A0A545UC28_9GAMM|nr:DUF885 domain-containing protein [Aliikangiella coralliicola]TQV87020.1 DUF885 domain-containing protein [Aliikangiella coralliicola]
MKYSSLLFFGLLFVLSCGGGGSSTPPQGTDEPPPLVLANVPNYVLIDTDTLLNTITTRLTPLTITEFFEESYKVLVERDHQSIIADGRLGEFQIEALELNNIADDFDIQTVAIKERILNLLLAYDRSLLSDPDKLSFDVYKAFLEFELEEATYRNFGYPATYGFFGWPGSTESFFTEVMPIANKSDAENYLALLNQIGRRFKQIETLLDTRQAAGVVEPSITLNFSKSQVDAMAQSAATATSYYQTFNEKVAQLNDVSSSERSTMLALLLATVEQRVLPAYQSLSNKMGAVLSQAPSNIGFGQFEGGEDFYNYRLRYFTSSNLTADQIHQLGLDELARIQAEMRVLFDQLGYPQNETLAQLFARVDAGAGIIAGNQAVEVYEQIIAEAYAELPNIFEQLPQQEVVVIGGESGGYYIAGADDGSRPGAFYAYTAGDIPYTTMPTLAYHEAVPGHHLQIALAQELNLPTFRRKENFTSFVEGWGLYAERLAKDLGWYENEIYADLGRLQFEAMRASRLVLDTGIHSKGWSYAQAEAFSLEKVGIPGSIARYSVWPGQATAYTTGMLKILELRELAETQLGNLYDIKEFHSKVIGSGSMPLNLLEEVINNYIAEKLAPAGN